MTGLELGSERRKKEKGKRKKKKANTGDGVKAIRHGTFQCATHPPTLHCRKKKNAYRSKLDRGVEANVTHLKPNSRGSHCN